VDQVWERFKEIKGCMLEGIYANQLSTYMKHKDIILYSAEPVFEIRNSSDITYWKFEYAEDVEGDDILLLNEQHTPEPVKYELVDNLPYQQHIILGSGFFVPNERIKKVTGYGHYHYEKDCKVVSSIVLELEEDLYITILPSAVIEIRITDYMLNDLGDIIFEEI